MLGRTVGAAIATGADPLAGDSIAARARFIEIGEPGMRSFRQGKRRRREALFFARPARGDACPDRGANQRGQPGANNHANDFGPEALLDSIARLTAGDVAAIGAGETTARSLRSAFPDHECWNQGGDHCPQRYRRRVERRFVIASAQDRGRVAAAIAEARANASFVLVFVHWGDENTDRVNERQRELARWLIDHGVDAVVGSHPHCVQPFDSYHGRPIIYSLGNLVFDGAPSLPNWNQGRLLEVDAGQPECVPRRFVWSRCSWMRAGSPACGIRRQGAAVYKPPTKRQRRFVNRRSLMRHCGSTSG